jgi:hypothetical protein
MTIDSSENAWKKADWSMHRRFEFDSHSTVFSLQLPAQQNGRSSSIEDGIRIEAGTPITQMSDLTSKSTNNSFTTLNETEPFSISIDLTRLCWNTNDRRYRCRNHKPLQRFTVSKRPIADRH